MLGIGVDWIALSFVQRPEDIVEIKRLILEYNPSNAFPPHVMAKIEKPSVSFVSVDGAFSSSCIQYRTLLILLNRLFFRLFSALWEIHWRRLSSCVMESWCVGAPCIKS